MVAGTSKTRIVVFVEGGSKGALATYCRRGFSKFFEKAGLKGRMPSVVSCGGRKQAYDSFCGQLKKPQDNTFYLLLVDSETPVTEESPWNHVLNREGDKWERPSSATNSHLHLMTQVMESWFLADVDSLRKYYGSTFMSSAVPTSPAKAGALQVEGIEKPKVFEVLRDATRGCSKGNYSKGSHSFQLLALIDPKLVEKASPWARRLLDFLRQMS